MNKTYQLSAISPLMALLSKHVVPMLAAALAVVSASGEWDAAWVASASPLLTGLVVLLASLVGGVDTDEVACQENRFLFVATSAVAQGAKISIVLLLAVSAVGDGLPEAKPAALFVAEIMGAMTVFSLITVRLAISKLLREKKRAAVAVGISESSVKFVKSIENDPFLAIEFKGFFGDGSSKSPVLDEGVAALGLTQRIGEYLKKEKVDHVFVSISVDDRQSVGGAMEQLLDSAVSVHYLHDFVFFQPIHESLSLVSGVPVYTVIGRPDGGVSGVLKRATDVIGAAVALVLLSPLLMLTAVAIKLESPGRVLFRQQRYGTDGKPFWIYKFRSMTQSACESQDVKQATNGDMRVTRIGRFVRRTSIDELPQLLNILRGEMSLVGPRPHAIPHNEYYRSLIRGYMVRHKVRPGLTGWAQVNGMRGETETVEKMEQRVRFDLDYMRRWSLGLDFYIILLTVKQVFRGV